MTTLIFLLANLRLSEASYAVLSRLKQSFPDVILIDDNSTDWKGTMADTVLILLSEAPQSERLDFTCEFCTNQCAKQRKRLVHVLKNYSGDMPDLIRSMGRRTSKMVHFHDLQRSELDSVIQEIRNMSSDSSSFSSPGQSFAWQLATGFLSYILPQLKSQLQSSLLDDQRLIKPEILEAFGVTDVEPKSILVIPKLIQLIDEDIVRGKKSVPMNPDELFPGCKKLRNGSTNLCLEFDSPGYKKRIPCYLMELDEPLNRDGSAFTHAVLFCGYAAPQFVMQKLEVSEKEKLEMLQEFRDELQFIMNHPKANEILQEFSELESTTDGSISEPSRTLHVIDSNDSLASRVTFVVEDYFYRESWCVVPRSEEPTSTQTTVVDDELPVMSMAFAMAANVWFGFAQLLLNHLTSSSQAHASAPFDLPYLFVIPKSGRYPDESKLLQRFAELGVSSSVEQFHSGRSYTYRVHSWKSRRIAFEIPMCVLSIRRQSQCSFGGIRSGDLGYHLAEFRDELEKFTASSGGRCRVVEWDDASELGEDLWSDPTADFAHSLLDRCLECSAHA